MTVQLDWPPDVVERLTGEARKKGLSLDAYLLQTVLQRKGSNGAPADDAEKRRAREEAGRSIRELRKGNMLGSDPTIRDLIEEGRRSRWPWFSTTLSRQRAQGLAGVLPNQRNCLAQTREAFFTRFAWTVGAGDLGAIRDIPWAIPLDNGCELVAHGYGSRPAGFRFARRRICGRLA